MANLGNLLGKTTNRVLQPFGLQIATNVPFLDRIPDLSNSEKIFCLRAPVSVWLHKSGLYQLSSHAST
jgi:hypothetical protein